MVEHIFVSSVQKELAVERQAIRDFVMSKLEIWNPGELLPSLTLAGLRYPHASIPRNPLIAEPLFLARYAEKAGSGILDMIALCREARLPTPQFRQEGGQFIQTLYRPRPTLPAHPVTKSPPRAGPILKHVKAKSPTQSGDPTVRLLTALRSGDLSSGELRQALGMKHRSTFRKNYLTPALRKGFVVVTLPDKPTSRFQKYRLTKKGRARLSSKIPVGKF